MTSLSTPEAIKSELHKALLHIDEFETCALLDYPNYLNIGDHLIWLGTIFYLTNVRQTKIKYVSSANNFSPAEMEKQIGKAPILFQGGGNLGDLWHHLQLFREKVIEKYRDRPIYILPQTIYFKNNENLEQAKKVFNSHPNLTIFVRDHYSYEIAAKNFFNCRILTAPDMAFHLVNMPGLSFPVPLKNSILFFCRRDHQLFSTNEIPISNLEKEDWISYTWMQRESINQNSYLRLPGIVRLVREGWQRGLSYPRQWISRQKWENFHPYVNKFETIYAPSLHKYSWSLMHSGIYQLKQHSLIITNRTHGHILSLILGIPHVFFPGSYHKNQTFYETWTKEIPFCKFVSDSSQIKQAATDLLANSLNK